jgi:hypothetical protein
LLLRARLKLRIAAFDFTPVTNLQVALSVSSRCIESTIIFSTYIAKSVFRFDVESDESNCDF